MISELEALYVCVDKIRMSEADRHMAKARLAQADVFAGLLLGAVDLAKRLLGSRPRPRPPAPGFSLGSLGDEVLARQRSKRP